VRRVLVIAMVTLVLAGLATPAEALREGSAISGAPCPEDLPGNYKGLPDGYCTADAARQFDMAVKARVDLPAGGLHGARTSGFGIVSFTRLTWKQLYGERFGLQYRGWIAPHRGP
jgi:hypothetical protein